jgi:low temperature requirement protein LtrA
VQRALTLVQMFTVAIMAANASEALNSRSAAGFAAAYAVMRIILVLQYVRAQSVERSKRLTNYYAAGFGLAALLWLVAAFLDAPERFWVWGAALAVEIGTPIFCADHDHELPPHPEHLPERFGLFTIILMGESLVAIMRGIESQETWSPHAASAAFFGMAFVFGLWWWYFDGAHAAKERHIRSRRDFRLFRVWSYAHFPMYLGVATVGIGVERVIGLDRGVVLRQGEAWLLATAATVVMPESKSILQLDLADLDERLGVRVLRDVRNDFLRVGSEAGLISFKRVKKKMTSCYVRRSRSRLLAGDPMFHGHALQS